MKNVIIEIIGDDAACCLIDGGEISGSEFESDFLDCCKSGDCQDACEYVLDQIGVEFRVTVKTESGEYENRLATDSEKQACCESIYFDSATDFTDARWAEIYLVWYVSTDITESAL